MLYIIAGPSGSGKTTFLKHAMKMKAKINIITVDVFSNNMRNYDFDLGRKKVPEEFFLKKEKNNNYRVINNYNGNKYGYSFSDEVFESKELYFLDYPGDYPECHEFIDYLWKGILILPPNKTVLKQRLVCTNRTNRIKSSIEEYNECIEEIKSNKFNEKWYIYINDELSKMNDYIEKVFQIL